MEGRCSGCPPEHRADSQARLVQFHGYEGGVARVTRIHAGRRPRWKAVVTREASEAPVAVFLDRARVLNRAIVRNGRPHPPATLEEFEILPRVPEACAALRRAGFVLLVVTNQP